MKMHKMHELIQNAQNARFHQASPDRTAMGRAPRTQNPAPAQRHPAFVAGRKSCAFPVR